MENNIILICSDEEEGSTDIVCSYLVNMSKNFIRFSSNDLIEIDEIKINDNEIDFTFHLKGEKLKYSNINSYWYRRSKPKFSPLNKTQFIQDGIDISKITNSFLDKEYDKLVEFVEDMLDQKALLNKFNDNNINKLTVLANAKKIGLNIPDTKIITKKQMLNDGNSYITKAISDLFGQDENYNYGVMTKEIAKDQISDDEFFYSLFQDKIIKQFELRIFFFDGEFYSSAIFSQNNPKTSIDFRNYDYEKPNRVIPYTLPLEIEMKLRELMNLLKLNSGSIDMLVDDSNRYIFLEINPIGQFEQVSFPCRYNLHKKIAEIL